MEKESPCLKFNCQECCNPVKLKEGFGVNKSEELKSLPFRKREEILIPKNEERPIRLESYDCDNLDKETGKCKNYENRPQICRETKCKAFETDSEQEQAEIINDIRAQEFSVCKK